MYTEMLLNTDCTLIKQIWVNPHSRDFFAGAVLHIGCLYGCPVPVYWGHESWCKCIISLAGNELWSSELQPFWHYNVDYTQHACGKFGLAGNNLPLMGYNIQYVYKYILCCLFLLSLWLDHRLRYAQTKLSSSGCCWWCITVVYRWWLPCCVWKCKRISTFL